MPQLAWSRWGATWTVIADVEMKALRRAPGGMWQLRDQRGRWREMGVGSTVRLHGGGRAVVLAGVGDGWMRVRFPNGRQGTIRARQIADVVSTPQVSLYQKPKPGSLPDIDALTPRIDADPDGWEKFEQHARTELSRVLPGLTFAGYRIGDVSFMQATFGPDPDDPDFGGIFPPHTLMWTVSILAGDVKVGDTARMFGRDEHTGRVWVEHKLLTFDHRADQGNRFAPEWNAWLENWYREYGVSEIRIQAGLDVGGYAWARYGFQFADEGEAWKVLRRLEAEVSANVAWLADHEHDDTIGDADYRAKIVETNAAHDILAAARDHAFGEAGFPTAYEISQAGRTSPAQDPKTAPWIGARAMLGAQWKGVKPL